jgi:hypothetical protein
MDEQRQLAMLKYIRDHDGATARAVARDVLGGPRTTFGRPLRVRRASTELQTLVEFGLLTTGPSGKRTIYLLSERGRTTLREASLGPELTGLKHPRP